MQQHYLSLQIRKICKQFNITRHSKFCRYEGKPLPSHGMHLIWVSATFVLSLQSELPEVLSALKRIRAVNKNTKAMFFVLFVSSIVFGLQQSQAHKDH